MEVKRIHIPEFAVEGKRLGRHVHHDPRSLGFLAPIAPEVVDVKHERRVRIYDQGEIGDCTGMSGCGMMCTGPFGKEDLLEPDAIQLYSDATKLDDVDGEYPPDDTGSSGIAIMKVLLARGWIKSYHHAFGLDHFLRALVLRPGIVGISWRENGDSPMSNGVIDYRGNVRGGHEIEAVGIDTAQKLVWFANSWGIDYALKGYFAMTFDDVDAALSDHGDATFADAA